MKRSRVRPSVRRSVCPVSFDRGRAACGGFAAERRAGGSYHYRAPSSSSDAAELQMRAVSR